MDQDTNKDKENVSGWRVSNHELVPKHEIMSQDEIADLLKRYKVKIEQLPKLLVTDPVAKEIGAEVGDIVKVTRKSPTSRVSVAYRLVVL